MFFFFFWKRRKRRCGARLFSFLVFFPIFCLFLERKREREKKRGKSLSERARERVVFERGRGKEGVIFFSFGRAAPLLPPFPCFVSTLVWRSVIEIFARIIQGHTQTALLLLLLLRLPRASKYTSSVLRKSSSSFLIFFVPFRFPFSLALSSLKRPRPKGSHSSSPRRRNTPASGSPRRKAPSGCTSCTRSGAAGPLPSPGRRPGRRCRAQREHRPLAHGRHLLLGVLAHHTAVRGHW